MIVVRSFVKESYIHIWYEFLQYNKEVSESSVLAYISLLRLNIIMGQDAKDSIAFY